MIHKKLVQLEKTFLHHFPPNLELVLGNKKLMAQYIASLYTEGNSVYNTPRSFDVKLIISQLLVSEQQTTLRNIISLHAQKVTTEKHVYHTGMYNGVFNLV